MAEPHTMREQAREFANFLRGLADAIDAGTVEAKRMQIEHQPGVPQGVQVHTLGEPPKSPPVETTVYATFLSYKKVEPHGNKK